MRCKIDENVPVQIADALNDDGHDCLTTYDEHLAGADDAAVIAACRAEGRVLISRDLGFAHTGRYVPGTHPGILVIRSHRQDVAGILELVRASIEFAKTDPIAGATWIAEAGRIRVRGRPTR